MRTMSFRPESQKLCLTPTGRRNGKIKIWPGHNDGDKVRGSHGSCSGDVIKAATSDRRIELEVERISPNTTRLRAVAMHHAVLRDGATANEIIVQTEKMLESLQQHASAL